MSSITRTITPWVTSAVTSGALRSVRRGAAEVRRRIGGEPHRVLYFHQLDDPYSQLTAQILPRLAGRWDVVIEPFLVGPPPDAAAPERARLENWSRLDAARVAPYYGLEFADRARQPSERALKRAASLLAAASPEALVKHAGEIGAALWSLDETRLDALAEHPPQGLGVATPAEIESACRRGDERRKGLGHYLGATFHYGGEWYWGVDRLHHLERRLHDLGLARAGAGAGPTIVRPDYAQAPVVGGNGAGMALEFYPSLRSPYTYIAMERTYALARRYGIELRLRPVLPMVMRGLPIPAEKSMYIVLDTKREADDAGIPFGHISDPVGRPVERGFSLYPLACARGRAAEYLLAFARAAWAEGIDCGTDEGLRHVVTAAGLDWQEAGPHLDVDAGWRAELEANRAQMFELGLWGVPSYRLIGPDPESDFPVWGQDRIWLLEAEIRRRGGFGDGTTAGA